MAGVTIRELPEVKIDWATMLDQGMDHYYSELLIPCSYYNGNEQNGRINLAELINTIGSLNNRIKMLEIQNSTVEQDNISFDFNSNNTCVMNNGLLVSVNPILISKDTTLTLNGTYNISDTSINNRLYIKFTNPNSKLYIKRGTWNITYDSTSSTINAPTIYVDSLNPFPKSYYEAQGNQWNGIGWYYQIKLWNTNYKYPEGFDRILNDDETVILKSTCEYTLEANGYLPSSGDYIQLTWQNISSNPSVYTNEQNIPADYGTGSEDKYFTPTRYK